MSDNMDSMLNERNHRISNGFLTSQIRYHEEFAPFARRPFTSFLIETTSKTFKIKLGIAFVVVNFLLLFFSGLLLYALSKRLTDNPLHAYGNQICYFASFSILFAFFPPIFSYDEPLQYCFIFLSFIALVAQKWIPFILFFSLALITRETTLLLLPALLLFFPGIRAQPGKIFTKEQLGLWGILLVPVLFYGAFLGIFLWKHQLWEVTKAEIPERYSCFLENFKNGKNTVESLVSLFLALGPFIYLTAFIRKKTLSLVEKKFLNAFLLTAVLNTIIVLLSSFARESRLFALPLVFLWPVFGQLFIKELSILLSLKLFMQLFKRWPFALFFVLLNLLNYFFCFGFYRKFGLGKDTYFAEYLFVINLLIITHFLLHYFLKKHPHFKKQLFKKMN